MLIQSAVMFYKEQKIRFNYLKHSNNINEDNYNV